MMSPVRFLRGIKRAGFKFTLWELYWTIRFLSVVKLLNLVKVVYQDLVSRPLAVSGFPTKLTIDPVNICNLHCPLCPTGQGSILRDKGRMNIERFKSLISEVGDYLFEIDLFNWGEPFLNDDIFNFIDYCFQKKIITRISSNMNFFPKGYESRLVSSKLHHLVVSLDGASPESYAKYRVGGSFEKVIEAVGRINAEKKKRRSPFPFVTWQFIVMRHNEAEVDEARRVYQSWGFDRTVFQRNRGDMGEELFETDKEKIDKHGEWIPQSKEDTNFDVVKRMRKEKPKTCHLPWTQSVVNWDSRVSPCCLYYDQSFDFGNVFDFGFSEVWNNRKYQEARRLIKTGFSNDKSLICWSCIKNGFPD